MYRAIIITLIILLPLFSCAQEKDELSGKRAVIVTELGDIEILLYDATPIHQENFIKLSGEGFYDDLLFHRVVKNFVIQGGDPNSRNASPGKLLGGSGPGYTIPAEIRPELYHKKGAIAAARQGDHVNPQRASSGSQFYIVLGSVLTQPQINFLASQGNRPPLTGKMIEDYMSFGGTPHLDGEYTVFGEVTKGIEIIEEIGNYEIDAYSRPLQDVKFSIRIID